jgi:hypothetical protein
MKDVPPCEQNTAVLIAPPPASFCILEWMAVLIHGTVFDITCPNSTRRTEESPVRAEEPVQVIDLLLQLPLIVWTTVAFDASVSESSDLDNSRCSAQGHLRSIKTALSAVLSLLVNFEVLATVTASRSLERKLHVTMMGSLIVISDILVKSGLGDTTPTPNHMFECREMIGDVVQYFLCQSEADDVMDKFHDAIRLLALSTSADWWAVLSADSHSSRLTNLEFSRGIRWLYSQFSNPDQAGSLAGLTALRWTPRINMEFISMQHKQVELLVSATSIVNMANGSASNRADHQGQVLTPTKTEIESNISNVVVTPTATNSSTAQALTSLVPSAVASRTSAGASNASPLTTLTDLKLPSDTAVHTPPTDAASSSTRKKKIVSTLLTDASTIKRPNIKQPTELELAILNVKLPLDVPERYRSPPVPRPVERPRVTKSSASDEYGGEGMSLLSAKKQRPLSGSREANRYMDDVVENVPKKSKLDHASASKIDRFEPQIVEKLAKLQPATKKNASKSKKEPIQTVIIDDDDDW